MKLFMNMEIDIHGGESNLDVLKVVWVNWIENFNLVVATQFSDARCRAPFQYRDHLSSNRDFQCKDKMVVRLSYLYDMSWSNSRIPQCTCPISHSASFRTEMCTFLFGMVHWDMGQVHCGICEIGLTYTDKMSSFWGLCIVMFHMSLSGLYIINVVTMLRLLYRHPIILFKSL